MSTRIKVCCIQSIEEAALAVHAGADAVGLVAAMPSGPGPIPEDRIAAIAATVPADIATFLLTSLTDPEAVVTQHRKCRTTTIQIVDRVKREAYGVWHKAMPGVELVQVIHVQDARAVDEAVAVAPYVDAILLDSGRPNAAVRVLGGTGNVHDWSISREIVEQCGKPVWLAGGLKPENVQEAIRSVRPYGVDVCSGLRNAGRLDPEKLRLFVSAVRAVEDAR